MLDKWLAKTKLNNVVEKIAKKLLYNRFTANQTTYIGFIFGLLSAFFIFLSGILQNSFKFLIISGIIMIISFFIDTLDGALARLKEPTTFGGILDIFCDRAVEVSIIIALTSTNPTELLWPGMFSLAAIILCITMFLLTGAALKSENSDDQEKVIYYRTGLMERSETFLFLITMTILYFWRFVILWIFAVLIFTTALLRLRDAYIIFKI